jgi:hypothetical protein
MSESNKKTILLFSVFSGTFFEVLEKDYEHFNEGYVPLKKLPSTNCKSCYGRGYTGRNKQNLSFQPCNCMRKVVNYEFIEQNRKC